MGNITALAVRHAVPEIEAERSILSEIEDRLWQSLRIVITCDVRVVDPMLLPGPDDTQILLAHDHFQALRFAAGVR